MHKNKVKKITGIIKITSKPLGFVTVGGSKREEDIVVFEEDLNCALDKDEVEVEIIGKDRERAKGKIIRVIKRNKTRFVGTIQKEDKNIFFRPDDFKFYRDVEIFDFPKKLEAGTKVLAEINWTNSNLNPRGKILSVIGKKGEHETEMQSILLDKGIIYKFTAEVEAEAEKMSRLNLDIGDRRDFRDITTFTIDPVDAKDFDDALSYEDLGENKIRVGVHIADVSHFVRPGSALDKEARERSFSTYLVDRTIPMLPEVLSNELCSLMANVDRFAFSAVFDIKKDTGEIIDRWFGKTIINSNKRFSYEEAQEVLDSEGNEKIYSPSLGHKVQGSQDSSFSIPLLELNRIANIYRKENKINGAIEFETDEVKFELDNLGKPIRIYKKTRLDTMKMIEEWMLLANREVAKFISDKLGKRGGASIFRIHNLPKMESLKERQQKFLLLSLQH